MPKAAASIYDAEFMGLNEGKRHDHWTTNEDCRGDGDAVGDLREREVMLSRRTKSSLSIGSSRKYRDTARLNSRACTSLKLGCRIAFSSTCISDRTGREMGGSGSMGSRWKYVTPWRIGAG